MVSKIWATHLVTVGFILLVLAGAALGEVNPKVATIAVNKTRLEMITNCKHLNAN